MARWVVPGTAVRQRALPCNHASPRAVPSSCPNMLCRLCAHLARSCCADPSTTRSDRHDPNSVRARPSLRRARPTVPWASPKSPSPVPRSKQERRRARRHPWPHRVVSPSLAVGCDCCRCGEDEARACLRHVLCVTWLVQVALRNASLCCVWLTSGPCQEGHV